MKQYRMTREEHDRWRRNQQYFQDVETGQILRALTINEVQRYEESIASGINPEVKVKGKVCRVVKERPLLLKEFIQKFGSVMLRRPNGTILKVARDPSVERPSYSPVETNVPSPELCACRDLPPSHKGRHHPTCQYNMKALPEQRATPEDFARYRGGTGLDFSEEAPKDEIEFVRPPVGVAAPVSGIPHPLECFCREWGNYNPAKGKQHNPVCQHFDAWMKLHPSGFQLVSVDSEKVLRAATADEVKKASLDMAHVITIGGEKYMVVDYDKAVIVGAEGADSEESANLGDLLDFDADSEVADTLPPPPEAELEAELEPLEADTVSIGPKPELQPSP